MMSLCRESKGHLSARLVKSAHTAFVADSDNNIEDCNSWALGQGYFKTLT